MLKEAHKLKLFVWTGFSPDYSDGLAFAIAHDEEEAKRLVTGDRGYMISNWGDVQVLPFNKPIAFSVLGGS